MNKLNKIISLLLVILFLNSCSGASDAGKVLRNEKITNTDEFFVKKRQPLNLPPDWKKVPEPGSLSNSKNKKKDIDRILKIPKEDTQKKGSTSVEKSIINRIGQ
tara:strand:- start:458 stop:769 length:312 start_codon:yes stop_codon:yes gene_type:complete